MQQINKAIEYVVRLTQAKEKVHALLLPLDEYQRQIVVAELASAFFPATSSTSKRKRVAVRAGAKREAITVKTGDGPTQKILRIIASDPEATAREIAAKVYGSEKEGPRRVHAIIHSLKKRGRVRATSSGYEVAR